MKLKNYILGIAVAGGLGMTSCCDLTPKIYSSLTTGNAYSTAAGMQAAVVSLPGQPVLRWTGIPACSTATAKPM